MTADLIRRTNALGDRIPTAVVGLALRLFPAAVFWMSGQTKMDGWFHIADSTWYLFETDYALPLLPPATAAVLAVISEHLFPILLALGLFTRASAFALLGMTLVIQTFIYPDAWPTHGIWAACLLALVAQGPGALSLDHALGLDDSRTASLRA